jgi:hypothetical protein
MGHKHDWRYTDRCCAFCANCGAESYHEEIIGGGRDGN